MLQIAWIKIENMPSGCVTDHAPGIAFALSSDKEGEALAKATIRCGDWAIETTDQINTLYTGPLKPFTQYDVYITATGTSGEVADGRASFVTGRLDTPWRGQWITDATYNTLDKQSPLPMTFRREFAMKKPVQRAWVNATALGVYELTLNGQKVGDDYFAPGFTSYLHQIQYQTYDVTALLAEQNTLLADVAGGWASGSFTHQRKNRIYADRQAFLCELFVEYEDGTQECVCTDSAWKVTTQGHYKLAEWYDGETYDATVDLRKIEWKKADVTAPRNAPRLLASYGAPVRVRQAMEPVSRTKAPSGEIIYDFGQNFAGVISARLRGKQGQTVVFRHAEVLVGGELFVKSLRSAKATATYICREGEQAYSPRLTYMGFRYVGVTGIDPDALELTALVLHSDIEETGSFSCSNPLLNRLQENIRWGGKSNFVDIPTDCPQRDEREGWTCGQSKAGAAAFPWWCQRRRINSP